MYNTEVEIEIENHFHFRLAVISFSRRILCVCLFFTFFEPLSLTFVYSLPQNVLDYERNQYLKFSFGLRFVFIVFPT